MIVQLGDPNFDGEAQMSDYAVINPATGEHIKDYPTITDAELVVATALAQKTHDEWSRTTSVAA